jgi:hypothetical protein
MPLNIIRLLAILIIISIAAPAVASITLDADGYEWLRYTVYEKHILLALFYNSLGVDKKKYNPKEMIRKLDTFYLSHVKEDHPDTFLKTPCVVLLGRETNCAVAQDFIF